jgi:hypothetical protein
MESVRDSKNILTETDLHGVEPSLARDSPRCWSPRILGFFYTLDCNMELQGIRNPVGNEKVIYRRTERR